MSRWKQIVFYLKVLSAGMGMGNGGEEEKLLKLLVSKFYGQATKGTRWMPWHFEAMKDVASCEKLRLGASIL